MTAPTITLDQCRALAADARAALRMIPEVVEQHAPPGSVPSEEMVEPPFVREAEVLVKGRLAIAAKRAGETTGGPVPSAERRKADMDRRKKLVSAEKKIKRKPR